MKTLNTLQYSRFAWAFGSIVRCNVATYCMKTKGVGKRNMNVHITYKIDDQYLRLVDGCIFSIARNLSAAFSHRPLDMNAVGCHSSLSAGGQCSPTASMWPRKLAQCFQRILWHTLSAPDNGLWSSLRLLPFSLFLSLCVVEEREPNFMLKRAELTVKRFWPFVLFFISSGTMQSVWPDEVESELCFCGRWLINSEDGEDEVERGSGRVFIHC